MPVPALNIQYPDLARSAVAGQTFQNLQGRNALMQMEVEKERGMRNALAGVKSLDDLYQPDRISQIIQNNPTAGINMLGQRATQAKDAQDRRIKMLTQSYQVLSAVNSLPEEQRPQAYQYGLKQLVSMYQDEMIPLLKSGKISIDYDPVEAHMMEQSLIPVVDKFKEANRPPSFHNIQQGDENVTLMGRGNKFSEVGRGPKFKPTSDSTKDTDISMFNKGIDDRYLVEKGRPPTPAERLEEWGKFKSQGKQTVSISVEQPLSGADEGLAQMLAKGELAPAELGKRTGNYNAVLARAKAISPDFNPRQADMDYGAGKTSGFRLKDITIQAMPQILRTVVDAGKDLDYSPVRFIAIAQQWKQKQLSDPDLVKYMALRNDALMSIAGVMRGVSATDQAHRVEIEAMEPTLPPKALEAWLEGQMESLKPRLKQFDQIYGRDREKTGTGEPTVNIPPISAFSGKSDGEPTRFKNGQVWALEGGKPVRHPELEGQ